MRLLRFVAVALMVTVSVASIGCAPEASTAPAAGSSSSTPAEGSEGGEEAGSDAAAGTTEVSLNVTGMT